MGGKRDAYGKTLCALRSEVRDLPAVEGLDSGAAVVDWDCRTGSGSEKAKRLFPGLEQIATHDDLAVVLDNGSDEGTVYLNDRAWIMVLYAMVEYREWAARLTHPLLMPLARQAFAALSKNRHFLSSFLSTETIAAELRKVEMEPCALPVGEAPASNVREFLQ